jgi:translation initiation factor 3 subunit G
LEPHFTTNCPHQHTEDYRQKIIEEKSTLPVPPSQPGKYVAPGFRDQHRHASGGDRDDAIAIRISNLSESTCESDLEDLLKPFGRISRMFLAKDKKTNDCKGFAYVHFLNRDDAVRAIDTLNGFGYDHLILKAEWSKPANT